MAVPSERSPEICGSSDDYPGQVPEISALADASASLSFRFRSGLALQSRSRLTSLEDEEGEEA